MFKSIKIFFSQLNESIKKIPPARRAVILITSGLVGAGFLFLVFWAQRPEYTHLFTKLSSEDSSIILEKLKSQKINYKIADQGKAILVPSEKVYELRLQLAGEGIPQSSSVGFEIFDRSTFGMTEFVQKLNYIRAIQGELARTISQLNEVEQARIHVVLPEKTLFKEDQNSPTASVVLRLKQGRKLANGQVQGIVHLIASSVEGLDPGNITVLDIHGKLLSGVNDSEPISKLTASQLDFKQNYERGTEKQIQSMLENVVGQGKVIVRISADLNFLQEERMEETYDPDSQIARSEQIAEDSSVGLKPVAGVPGVQSNLPGAGVQGVRDYAPPTTSRVNKTYNYELNKITRKIVEPVGTLKRLSVAVALDGTYEPGKKGERPKYIERSQENMKKYEELVKNAVGFNIDRGDTIEVTNMPFESVDVWEERQAMDAEADRHFWLKLIEYSLSAFVLLVIVFFVLKPVINWVINLEGDVTTPKTIGELEAEMAQPADEQKQEAEKRGFRHQMVDYAYKEPEKTAELVKNWLKRDAV